jgi:hypothetical protein
VLLLKLLSLSKENNFFWHSRIPFIIIQNKKDRCFEGRDSACHRETTPVLCDSAVITLSGVIALGGAKVAGVKPP